MNLSKRALYLIVPVIFLSYCLAGVFVYFTLEKSIAKLEQNRLDLALTNLASSFNQYSTFSESYLHALLENSAFRNFLEEEDELFQKVALSSSIEKAIRGFKQHQSEKLSFLIVQTLPEQKELYYFELSDDPFAEINQSLRENYRAVLSERSVSAWDYMTDIDNNHDLIVITRLVDRSSFAEPVSGQIDNSVLVQFSLEPSLFLARRKQVTALYGSDLVMHDSSTLASDQGGLGSTRNRLFSSTEIGFGKTISIAVPASYIEQKLANVKVVLLCVALLFFVLSSVLIYRLIRKHITSPITLLEHELSEVMAYRKPNITLHNIEQGEVGRLQRAFHQLYGDLSRSYLKVKKLAERDHLTDLHNLSYITERAEEAILYADKHDECVGFIYIDLDNFKFVNDQYGHEVGDSLLKAFSTGLTQIVNAAENSTELPAPKTIHGRIAGDEFSVMVRNITDEKMPAKIAHDIQSMFQNGFSCEKGHFQVSVSIGIAMYPQDGETLSQVVSNADNAMYQAKSNGKNTVEFYSKELAAQMRRQMEVEQALKSMNPDEEFFLVYMPLINAKTNQIDGFEVLLRWVSKKLGFVGPDEFVPIAEVSGLFNIVDEWVVKNAIKSYPDLKAKLGHDFKLSINLSSAQLNNNLITKTLLESVKQYDISPENVQLEMTETLSAEYTHKADALLNVLCDQGFQIAIDDFGTGYTALLQLIEYPAKMIKFDKTFVDKAMQSNNRKMLAPLISLCHSQGLSVTVEGVETKEIADYLKSIKCDYLQGYYYGKPVKLNELNLANVNALCMREVG